MAVVLPPPVKAGDAVSVVAPASDVNWEILEKAVTVLRSWGLEPVVHPQVYERRGYTAGSDEERAQGIVDAFDDARTTAVICAKGGYGCTRLTAFLSAEKLGPHNVPRKRFFGFSDITAIHSAMRIAVPGYVSFHAPMPASLAFQSSSDESKDALRRALFSSSLKDACPPLKIIL
ncbi:hypothetical protein Mapa_003761 [Marchantia paleacea]|nr:hypothetical protein Mapa_003761 [Marchantia paleacea]